jgi:hypothetical protein
VDGARGADRVLDERPVVDVEELRKAVRRPSRLAGAVRGPASQPRAADRLPEERRGLTDRRLGRQRAGRPRDQAPRGARGSSGPSASRLRLAQIADRLDIQEVLTRVHRAIDTGDWDRLDPVFTPDAAIDHARSGGIYEHRMVRAAEG